MELIILLLIFVLFIKVLKAPLYFFGTFGQLILLVVVLCILLACCSGL